MKKLLTLAIITALSFTTFAGNHERKERATREPREKKERVQREPRERKVREPREKKERTARTPREKTPSDVPRDNRGRIARSSKATRDFKKQTGYPHGRKGYVIDHIKPLKEGGRDTPDNMQWQTIDEAKAKDKTE